jgi:hypothetical protein
MVQADIYFKVERYVSDRKSWSFKLLFGKIKKIEYDSVKIIFQKVNK